MTSLVRDSVISAHSPSPSQTNLGCFGERLCDSAVSATVARGDEVGHAAALQEGGRAHLTFAEQLGEGDHFHQAQSDHRRLGVVSKTKAVAESSTDRHDILTWSMLLWVTECVRNHDIHDAPPRHTFRAPHSSTVSLSWTMLMRKFGV